MHNSTAIFSSANTESGFSLKARAFLNELRHVLELVGRSYLHGVTPL